MSYSAVTLGRTTPCGGQLELVMKAAELKRLLISMTRLSSGQRAEVLAALDAGGQDEEVRLLLESHLVEQRACPHCQASWIVRNGSASGLQRYKCRACGRTFNPLSTTPLGRLRMKAKWLQQQDALQQGLSVSKAASTLDAAKITAFRWRHRFLQLAQPVKASERTGVAGCGESRRDLLLAIQQRPAHWQQIAQARRAWRQKRGMDLTPILVARDRSGATADFLLEAASKACLSQALLSRIQSDAVLCTDGSAAIAAAAEELHVQHEAVNRSDGERVRGPWHIQNANAYHGRLKAWLARFKGVATSYLESYLGWFRALDRASKSRLKTAPMMAPAVGLDRHH
jgi:transposase-like protein